MLKLICSRCEVSENLNPEIDTQRLDRWEVYNNKCVCPECEENSMIIIKYSEKQINKILSFEVTNLLFSLN